MPYRFAIPAALCAVLALAGCRQQTLPAEAPPAVGAMAAHASGNRPVPTLGPDDALPSSGAAARPVATAVAPPRGFEPARVPESTAALPPFPLLPAPAGLTGLYDAGERELAFAREHMIAGDRVVALEGRVFRQRYRLAGGERPYSELEFQRHYADAIDALGGIEVSRVQYTGAVNAAFGGRAAVDEHYHGTCASHGCENHTYLIRQHGREYWIQISTGAIPPHGQVTVLTRTG